jgi:secondary thiamine-phosphate synthase enzyme
MEILVVSSKKAKEVVDITDDIQTIVKNAPFEQGVCSIFIKHTTAAVSTADLDPGTDLDMLDAFSAMMPKLSYRHPHNPKHAPDHILSSVIGSSVSVPVVNGTLSLGTWQRIVLIELDGPRERELIVSLLKE